MSFVTVIILFCYMPFVTLIKFTQSISPIIQLLFAGLCCLQQQIWSLEIEVYHPTSMVLAM